MRSTGFLALASFLSVLATVRATYHWPSPQYDQLEGLLYEKTTEEGSRMITAPLENCHALSPSTHEDAAANWLRMAFHDMATHDVDTGLGGMDSSIYYELGYRGNIGIGMTETEANFAPFTTKYISKADVLAMGVVLLTAECQGPLMSYRGGRIDSYTNAPDTAPLPFDTIETHLSKFQHEGMNQTEMITMVACGHTVGGVRNPDFPTIVPPGPGEPEEPYVYLFDPTTRFDNKVVTQYLDGTTTNPLVVNSNSTVQSDLRVYSSDGNATMRTLADSKVFEQSCGTVFEKMINTVAVGVTLTDPIAILPAKVAGVQLSVEPTGSLSLKASLRLLTANPKRKVTLQWASKSGRCAQKSCSVSFSHTNDTTTYLTSRQGYKPQKYYFTAPIDADASISNFWFEVDEGLGQRPTSLNNGGTGYEITQDNILFVPSQSKNNNNATSFDIVVAAKNTAPPSRVYADIYQTIPHLPFNSTVEFAVASAIKPVAGYTFYTANVPGPQFTFDLHSVVNGVTYTEDARDTFFITA